MADLMPDTSQAAKQANDAELVALKQQMDRLRGDITPGSSKMQKLRKACSDFEAVFISKMWEQMRNTIPKGGMFNTPQAEMYRSMFDRDFAEKLAGDGGMGLGDMLYGQLKDKLKNVVKTTKGADAGAPASGEIVRTDLKMPKRADAAQASGVEAAAQQPATAVQQSSAALPASVPAGVMEDVEALANRIEADYARRQARAAGYGKDPAGAGRKLAVIG